jgi:cytochrome P450 / NADPH-cytochrome P450 reductase
VTTALQDVLAPSMYSHGIPHELLGDLRREHGVLWVDEPATDNFKGGSGYWLVLRHADVSHVSRHPEDFSSWRGTSLLREQRPTDVEVLRRMMLNMDPPEHSPVRKIVNRAFTPQAIRKQLADSITRHAREVVDAICETGQTDYLATIAAEMPLLVLADVLGVPAEDRALLCTWTNRLVGIDDPEYGADPAGFISAFTEMFAYAREATEQRRKKPTDDLWSTIVNAEVDGEHLSDGELDRFFQLLCIAGNDTTRNLLANTMLTLSRHPDQFESLRQDLSLLPRAIEEVLRFSPSVIQFRRTATHDLDFAGHRIAEDDRVIINYASANRDETVFEQPDRFDITRDPNPHISFGYGTHFCLGANLTRLQVRVLLTELFTRLPDIEVDGEPSHLQSSFMNGIKHLPVSFTPTDKLGPNTVPGAEESPATNADSVGTATSAAPSHRIRY